MAWKKKVKSAVDKRLEDRFIVVLLVMAGVFALVVLSSCLSDRNFQKIKYYDEKLDCYCCMVSE